MRPTGGSSVQGTPVPSVVVLLLFFHRGYVFLEAMIVTSHEGRVGLLSRRFGDGDNGNSYMYAFFHSGT